MASDNKRKIGIAMTKEIDDRTNLFCEITGIPKFKVVEMALEDLFEKHKEKFREVEQYEEHKR